jgi:hypothetical protein
MRHGLVCAAVGIGITAAVCLPASLPASAQQLAAIAFVKTELRPTKNTKAIQGAGAVAAHARVGGNNAADGAILIPDAGGAPFSDRTTVAGTTKKSLLAGAGGPLNDIGNGLRVVYPGVSTNSFDAARDFILYRVVEDRDKVALAKANGNMFNTTTGVGKVVAAKNKTLAFARAEQLINLAPPGKVNTTGTAIAELDEFAMPLEGKLREKAFAVAVVHDPIEFGLEDSSESGIVDLLIDREFHLDAPYPDTFASAAFEIAGGEGTGTSDENMILSFHIAVDHSDADIDNVTFELGDHNPLIVPDPTIFEDDLRALFAFDDTTHSLHFKLGAGGADPDGVPLFQFVLPPGSIGETVRFDYSGIVGSSVPEPSGWIALSSLAVSCLLVRRKCANA